MVFVAEKQVMSTSTDTQEPADILEDVYEILDEVKTKKQSTRPLMIWYDKDNIITRPPILSREYGIEFIPYKSIEHISDKNYFIEFMNIINKSKENELQTENNTMIGFKFFNISKKIFYSISAITLPLLILSLFIPTISIYVWSTALLGSFALAVTAHTYELNLKNVR
jgi:hypothetical protein